MKARIQWAGEAMFLGESGSGHVVVMNGARAVVVRGPIKQLDTAAMNKLGWYRA